MMMNEITDDGYTHKRHTSIESPLLMASLIAPHSEYTPSPLIL